MDGSGHGHRSGRAPHRRAGLTGVAAASSRWGHLARVALPALTLAWISLALWNCAKPLPPGTHFASQTSRLSESEVDFWSESAPHPGAAASELNAIDHAEQLIVLDRSPLTAELAQHLLARKHARPNIKIVLVTDPAHPAFGGTPAPILAALEQSGIIVSRVRLTRLRDSNPLYSGLWRLLVAWWSDPFDEPQERVTLATRLRMQNGKADQRQLTVADDGSGGWVAVMVPAGAAAGLTLRGSVARAMIASELQIADWSTDDDRLPAGPPLEGRGVGAIDVRFLTEGAIAAALLDDIRAAGNGDEIGMAVDDLADRRLIAALLAAAARGVQVQVLLRANAMPNSSVAGELTRGGGRIQVRRHSGAVGSYPKLLLVRHRADSWLTLGSANFTRRHLDDLNLEAAVTLRLPARAAPARAAADYFARLWAGAAAADTAAAGTADFAQTSAAEYWRYRWAEATGLSRF
jgi:hypothetical protein